MPDTPNSRARFVILISGQGSNMQAIVQACQAGRCSAQVVAVLASRAQTVGLAWAEEQGIATDVVPHVDFASREAFDEALAQKIDAFAPDYVLLAGFMRVLTPAFVARYSGRLINIHPLSLACLPRIAYARTSAG